MANTLRLAFDNELPASSKYNESVWKRWNGLTRREQTDNFLERNEKFVLLLKSLRATSASLSASWLSLPTWQRTGQMRLNELMLPPSSRSS